MSKLPFRRLVLRRKPPVDAASPCITQLINFNNTLDHANVSMQIVNSCGYDNVYSTETSPTHLTFGLPYGNVTAGNQYFSVGALQLLNTIDFVMQLRIFHNHNATGMANLSVTLAQYIECCPTPAFSAGCVKSGSGTIPFGVCTGPCSPSGCFYTNYNCTIPTRPKYFNVSAPGYMKIDIRNPAGVYDAFTLFEVNVLNSAHAFVNNPLISGSCTSPLPINNTCQLSRTYCGPTQSQSFSQSQSPSPSFNEDNAPNFPLSEPAYDAPIIRLLAEYTDGQTVITNTSLNCFAVTKMWPKLLANDDHAPFFGVSIPLASLGILPANVTSNQLYVTQVRIVAQADFVVDSFVVVAGYQSTCGRYYDRVQISQIPTGTVDESDFCGGDNTTFGMIQYTSNSGLAPPPTFLDGSAAHNRPESLVLLMFNDVWRQAIELPILYITEFRVTLNSGAQIYLDSFIPYNVSDLQLLPEILNSYRPIDLYGYEALKTPVDNCTCLRCTGAAISADPDDVDDTHVLTNGLPYFINPLTVVANYTSYVYPFAEAFAFRRNIDDVNDVNSPTAVDGRRRIYYETYDFLNPFAPTRALRHDIADSGYKAGEYLSRTENCGILLLIDNGCMGNMEVWLTPTFAEFPNRSTYYDYEDLAGPHAEGLGFKCRVMQAASATTFAHLVVALSDNMEVRSDPDFVDIGSGYPYYYDGAGEHMHDYDSQPHYIVNMHAQLLTDSTPWRYSFNYSYGFRLMRPNIDDDYNGISVSCDLTTAGRQEGRTDDYIAMFAGKNYCVVNDGVLQKRLVEGFDLFEHAPIPQPQPQTQSNVESASPSAVPGFPFVKYSVPPRALMTFLPMCSNRQHDMDYANGFTFSTPASYYSDYTGPAWIFPMTNDTTTFVNPTPYEFNFTIDFDRQKLGRLIDVYVNSSGDPQRRIKIELYSGSYLNAVSSSYFATGLKQSLCLDSSCPITVERTRRIADVYELQFPVDIGDGNYRQGFHAVSTINLTGCIDAALLEQQDVHNMRLHIHVPVGSLFSPPFDAMFDFYSTMLEAVRITVSNSTYSDYLIYRPAPTVEMRNFQLPSECYGACPLALYDNEFLVRGDAVVAISTDHINSSYAFDDLFTDHYSWGLNYTPLKWIDLFLQIDNYVFADYPTEGSAYEPPPGYDYDYEETVGEGLYKTEILSEFYYRGNGFMMRNNYTNTYSGDTLERFYIFTFDDRLVSLVLNTHGKALAFPFQPGIYVDYTDKVSAEGFYTDPANVHDIHIFGTAVGVEFVVERSGADINLRYNNLNASPNNKVNFVIGFFDFVFPDCRRDFEHDDADVVCLTTAVPRAGPILGPVYGDSVQLAVSYVEKSTNFSYTTYNPLNAATFTDVASGFAFTYGAKQLRRPYDDYAYVRMGDNVDDQGMLGAQPIFDTVYSAFEGQFQDSAGLPYDEIIAAFARFRFAINPCATDCFSDASHRVLNHPDSHFSNVVDKQFNANTERDLGDVISWEGYTVPPVDYGLPVVYRDEIVHHSNTSNFFDSTGQCRSGMLTNTVHDGNPWYWYDASAVNMDRQTCAAAARDFDDIIGSYNDYGYPSAKTKFVGDAMKAINTGMFMDLRHMPTDAYMFGVTCQLMMKTNKFYLEEFHNSGPNLYYPENFQLIGLGYNNFLAFQRDLSSAAHLSYFNQDVMSGGPFNYTDSKIMYLHYSIAPNEVAFAPVVELFGNEEGNYDYAHQGNSPIELAFFTTFSAGGTDQMFRFMTYNNRTDVVQVLSGLGMVEPGMPMLDNYNFYDVLPDSNSFMGLVQQCSPMFDDSLLAAARETASPSQTWHSPTTSPSDELSEEPFEVTASPYAKSTEALNLTCCVRDTSLGYGYGGVRLGRKIREIKCAQLPEESEEEAEGADYWLDVFNATASGGVCDLFAGPAALESSHGFQLRDEFVALYERDFASATMKRLGLRLGYLWLSFTHPGTMMHMYYNPSSGSVIINGTAWGVISDGNCTLNRRSRYGFTDAALRRLHVFNEVPYYFELRLRVYMHFNELVVGGPDGPGGVAFTVREPLGSGASSVRNTGLLYPLGHKHELTVYFGLHNVDDSTELAASWLTLVRKYQGLQMLIVSSQGTQLGQYGWTGLAVVQVNETVQLVGPPTDRDLLLLFVTAVLPGVSPDGASPGRGTLMFAVEFDCDYLETLIEDQIEENEPLGQTMSPSAMAQSLLPSPSNPVPAMLELPLCLPLSDSMVNGGRYICGLINDQTWPRGGAFFADPAIVYGSGVQGGYNDYDNPFPDEIVYYATFVGSYVRGYRKYVKNYIPPMANRKSIVVNTLWSAASLPLPPNLFAFVAATDMYGNQQGADVLCPLFTVTVDYNDNDYGDSLRAYCEIDYPETSGYLLVGIKTIPRYILQTDITLNGVGLQFRRTDDCAILKLTFGSAEPSPACLLGLEGNPSAQGTNDAISYWLNSDINFLFFMS